MTTLSLSDFTSYPNKYLFLNKKDDVYLKTNTDGSTTPLLFLNNYNISLATQEECLGWCNKLLPTGTNTGANTSCNMFTFNETQGKCTFAQLDTNIDFFKSRKIIDDTEKLTTVYLLTDDTKWTSPTNSKFNSDYEYFYNTCSVLNPTTLNTSKPSTVQYGINKGQLPTPTINNPTINNPTQDSANIILLTAAEEVTLAANPTPNQCSKFCTALGTSCNGFAFDHSAKATGNSQCTLLKYTNIPRSTVVNNLTDSTGLTDCFLRKDSLWTPHT